MTLPEIKDEYAAGQEPEHFRKLFIGGLTPATTEDSLREFYGQWGQVVDVVVMRDPLTKRSRGFGFVTYSTKAEVDLCMGNRPHSLDGKTVDPKRAVPREASSQGEANVPSKRLYVSGVREDHTEQMFMDYFSKYGTIEKVDIVSDKLTGKARGFAFVTFNDNDSVDQCVLIKSHQINGYRCDVKKGLSKDEMAKAQQNERDRAERSARSRGPGGTPSRGGGRGGMGGGWPGQAWGGPGGNGGGYGRGGGAAHVGWGDQRGAAAQGAWGGYGGGGYGGGDGGWGQQAWGQQQQGAWGAGGGQQQWGQQPQQGGAAGYGGGYGGAAGGRSY